MRRSLKVLLAIGIIFTLIQLGPPFSGSSFNRDFQPTPISTPIWSPAYADDLTDSAQLLNAVLTLISKYYVDEIKLKEIVYPAIKEMVNKLDPHSHFLTPEENAKMQEEEKDVHEYAGIGMMFGTKGSPQEIRDQLKSNGGLDVNELTYEVKKVFDGSPAQKSGILPKDELIAIDDVPMKEIGAEEIKKIGDPQKKLAEKMERIRKAVAGQAGTTVKITVKRGSAQTLDFVIVRGIIAIKNVEWKMIDSAGKKFGYVKINNFVAESTAKDFARAMTEFKNVPVGGVIVDLKDNPGGRVDLVKGVLEQFLPPDTLIIKAKGRSGAEELYSGLFSTDYPCPVVILINQGSASASEIMAGTLRDYKRAILIGEKTYGKGSMQFVWNLPDGSSLRITARKYFLPNGECIHEKGIAPDIAVKTEFDETIIAEALKVLGDWDTYRAKYLK